MLVILTTWDADFGRITVRGQMGKELERSIFENNLGKMDWKL
jgi:hypothetical protein